MISTAEIVKRQGYTGEQAKRRINNLDNTDGKQGGKCQHIDLNDGYAYTRRKDADLWTEQKVEIYKP